MAVNYNDLFRLSHALWVERDQAHRYEQ